MVLSLAQCPPVSLHDQYLALLSQVESFRVDGDALTLFLANDAGEMGFLNPDA